MITVAPVHCKYGRFLPISCFYSIVKDTVIWDAVCLCSSILNYPLVQFENEVLLRMFNRQSICARAKCTRLPKKIGGRISTKTFALFQIRSICHYSMRLGKNSRGEGSPIMENRSWLFFLVRNASQRKERSQNRHSLEVIIKLEGSHD